MERQRFLFNAICAANRLIKRKTKELDVIATKSFNRSLINKKV